MFSYSFSDPVNKTDKHREGSSIEHLHVCYYRSVATASKTNNPLEPRSVLRGC